MHLKKYYFINKFDPYHIKKLNKNTSIIYRNYNSIIDIKYFMTDEFNDIKFVKINGPDNPDFCQKYGISSYPKLMIVENGKHKIFPSDDRNLKDLRKFLM